MYGLDLHKIAVTLLADQVAVINDVMPGFADNVANRAIVLHPLTREENEAYTLELIGVTGSRVTKSRRCLVVGGPRDRRRARGPAGLGHRPELFPEGPHRNPPGPQRTDQGRRRRGSRLQGDPPPRRACRRRCIGAHLAVQRDGHDHGASGRLGLRRAAVGLEPQGAERRRLDVRRQLEEIRSRAGRQTARLLDARVSGSTRPTRSAPSAVPRVCRRFSSRSPTS